MSRMTGEFIARTDKGRVRLTNEDQAKVLMNAKGDVLLVVADGMGGHAQGDLASKLASERLINSFKDKGGFFSTLTAKRWLLKTIRQANKEIFDESETNENFRGMGTTLVVVLIRQTKMLIANIGDSRAYIFNREDRLEQITEDQNYSAYLARTNLQEKAGEPLNSNKHALTNALGIHPSSNIAFNIRDYNYEKVFLCSDGLYNSLSDPEIERILSIDDGVEQKADLLIKSANKAGGSDNIAVAIWEPEL